MRTTTSTAWALLKPNRPVSGFCTPCSRRPARKLPGCGGTANWFTYATETWKRLLSRQTVVSFGEQTNGSECVFADASPVYSELPPSLRARTRNVYVVLALRPEMSVVVTFAPSEATSAYAPPATFCSTV